MKTYIPGRDGSLNGKDWTLQVAIELFQKFKKLIICHLDSMLHENITSDWIIWGQGLGRGCKTKISWTLTISPNSNGHKFFKLRRFYQIQSLKAHNLQWKRVKYLEFRESSSLREMRDIACAYKKYGYFAIDFIVEFQLFFNNLSNLLTRLRIWLNWYCHK